MTEMKNDNLSTHGPSHLGHQHSYFSIDDST